MPLHKKKKKKERLSESGRVHYLMDQQKNNLRSFKPFAWQGLLIFWFDMSFGTFISAKFVKFKTIFLQLTMSNYEKKQEDLFLNS